MLQTLTVTSTKCSQEDRGCCRPRQEDRRCCRVPVGGAMTLHIPPRGAATPFTLARGPRSPDWLSCASYSLQEERWRCKFFDEVLICKFLRVANPKFLKGKKTRSMLPKMSSWRKQTDLAHLPSQAHRYVADPHHNTATNHTKNTNNK